MPETLSISKSIKNESESLVFGADIALILKAGDMLALSGELGAGKSFLARAIIRSLAENAELEVPSPTYTICQNYETTPPIHHLDLYRLSEITELEELGWHEMLESGIVLMEWPECVFDTLPPEAILMRITDKGENERLFECTGNSDLIERIKHSLKLRDFIDHSPFSGAERSRFSADASARNYELLHYQDKIHYLMDAPRMPDGPPIQNGLPYSKIAHLAEDVSAFVAIDMILRENGFCAPEIFAQDLSEGFLLIENIGDGKIVDDEHKPIEECYLASIEFLAELHSCHFSHEVNVKSEPFYVIPEFDEGVILAETDLLLQWYAPEFAKKTITTQQGNEFQHIWKDLFAKLQSVEQTLVLRDYHSPNIIWRKEQTGIDRIGVIDFQDALIGPSVYDVASLAQDARVDVSVELEDKLMKHYINLRTKQTACFDETVFNMAYAIMSAQRATKILGIFVRLNKRDQKPEYMKHLPRITDYLKRSLKHPILADYKAWFEDVINLKCKIDTLKRIKTAIKKR